MLQTIFSDAEKIGLMQPSCCGSHLYPVRRTPKTRRAPNEIVRALLDKTRREERNGGRGARGRRQGRAADHQAPARPLAVRVPAGPQPSQESRTRTIREACEELLRREPGLRYDEILLRVRAEFAGLQARL
jgi:hypothetical protein